MVVVLVVVVVVVAGSQQSNPTGNPAPQLSKLLSQERLVTQSESLSQSPSPSIHGHTGEQHAQSVLPIPQDGQPKLVEEIYGREFFF